MKSAWDYPVQPGTATAETTDIFKQTNIDRQAVIYEEHAGPGKWNTHAEEQDVEEATPRSGNKTTKEVENWKQDLPIPKEFYDDDQHNLVAYDVQVMGREGRNSRDQNALNVYANGFDVITTPDAAYLFSNSHTNLNGDTVDNLETGAMSVANLETLFNSLYLQKNQAGRLGGHDGVALLVSPNLFPDTQEITKSALQANTTDNNINYFSQIYPGLRVYRSPWLNTTYSAYSSINTCFFLVSQNHTITRCVREAMNTTLVPWQFDGKDRYKYRGRFREVCYAGSWEGVAASNGTA